MSTVSEYLCHSRPSKPWYVGAVGSSERDGLPLGLLAIRFRVAGSSTQTHRLMPRGLAFKADTRWRDGARRACTQQLLWKHRPSESAGLSNAHAELRQYPVDRASHDNGNTAPHVSSAVANVVRCVECVTTYDPTDDIRAGKIKTTYVTCCSVMSLIWRLTWDHRVSQTFIAVPSSRGGPLFLCPHESVKSFRAGAISLSHSARMPAMRDW